MRTQQQAVGIETKNNAIAFFRLETFYKIAKFKALNTSGILFKHS